MTKNKHIRVYMSRKTKEKIVEQAEKEGLKPSVWLRHKAKKNLPQEVQA